MEIKATITFNINTDTTNLKTEALAKDFVDELIFNTYKSNMHVFDEVDLEWSVRCAVAGCDLYHALRH